MIVQTWNSDLKTVKWYFSISGLFSDIFIIFLGFFNLGFFFFVIVFILAIFLPFSQQTALKGIRDFTFIIFKWLVQMRTSWQELKLINFIVKLFLAHFKFQFKMPNLVWWNEFQRSVSGAVEPWIPGFAVLKEKAGLLMLKQQDWPGNNSFLSGKLQDFAHSKFVSHQCQKKKKKDSEAQNANKR